MLYQNSPQSSKTSGKTRRASRGKPLEASLLETILENLGLDVLTRISILDAPLSKREREILTLTLQGYSRRETGERFGLSQQRISQILEKIFPKLL